MNFAKLAALGAACALAGCAGFTEYPPQGENWVGLAEGDARGGYWPKAAAKAGIEGWVRLVCTVDSDKRLHNCMIAEETPPGWGFGEAALRMREGFLIQSHPVERGEEISMALFFCRDAFSPCGWAAFEEDKAIERRRQERARGEKLRA